LRLAVDKLAKAYGFLWALRDLRFDLAPGELVALLGPNGAGKTTLLKLLAGLIAPTTGTIRIDGAPVSRAKIGLLAPADHLYDNLTVTENLRFFSALYNRPQRADAMRKGNIVIMASHHVARVLRLCSRALILHQGRLTFNEAKQRPWTSFDEAYSEFLPHGESWSS